MPKFKVEYSTRTNYEIDVEAENAEQAHRLVEDGEANLDFAEPIDEDNIEVHNVVKL